MNKVLGYLQKLQIAAGGVFLTIFLCSVVIQMGCRYVGVAAIWTEDVSMYSFIWAAFMGAGAMVYEKRHFAFTSVSDMLKNEKVKRMLSVGISIVMLVFAVLMLYYGCKITKQFWNYRWVSLPDLKRGPTWLCIPVCGGTSTLYLIGQIIEDVKSLSRR
ncbi:TRAP transporter small permease [Lacrimispora sp. 210928-DFI.3.58]|uniref:TRAP transporter small permease n=1 Tax=Lacrimispora sp. 210928-DFI.3.58 TaxID=2883214 RepID=UPI0015B3F9FC|nr:TRAP transporter small permease [Lacrimispora sp. 210928-DFI.3.58]MCB7319340.1 TRAP transporter small permease [Lacrimispora sp. 210928-DFI.3.58]